MLLHQAGVSTTDAALLSLLALLLYALASLPGAVALATSDRSTRSHCEGFERASINLIPRYLLRACFVLGCLTMLVSVPSSVASPSSAPSRALVTAVDDPMAFSGPKAYIALARTRGAGAESQRSSCMDQVAPGGRQRPAGFDAIDPEDPAYRWDGFDALVKTTVKQNLEPLVIILNAPTWANLRPRPGTSPTGTLTLERWPTLPRRPRDATAAPSGPAPGPLLASLERAELLPPPRAAVQHAALAAVRRSSRLLSPDIYRAMVNSFADAVHERPP